MRWITVLSTVLWAMQAQLGQGQAAETEHGRMTVTGVGVVDSQPDMATLTLGVTAQAPSAQDALDQVAVAGKAVLAQLQDAGVAARDVQTRDLSLQPVWENRRSGSTDRPGIIGYRASTMVMVRIRALDGLGAVLDRAVSEGANQFHGLQFGLQDPVPAQDEARRAAVAEAMRKATLYAQAAGLLLGPVIELTEAGSPSPQPMMMDRMATMAEAMPIAQGEVSTRMQVTIVFATREP